MRIKYFHESKIGSLAADLQQFVKFLEAHGAEFVSELEISCYPWRNGKRLQAVDEDGNIVSIGFDLNPKDPRYVARERELDRGAKFIRERPDDLGEFGLAFLAGRDD